MSFARAVLRFHVVFFVLIGAGTSTAHAEFESPVVISARPGTQATGPSTQIAVAAGGDFAVFRSAAENLYTGPQPVGFTRSGGGIFRSNLATRELEVVVPQQLRNASTGNVAPGVLNGAAPSVSADGRFVVFAGSMALDPEDKNGMTDVYRRDMTVAIGQPGAYTLVSAIDGADVPLLYAGRNAPDGSVVKPHAISDDGNRIAFTTTVSSGLGELPPSKRTPAPAGQVVVRDVLTKRTILLSTTRLPPHGPAPTHSQPNAAQPATLKLSGDGSTVAWAGTGANSQVELIGNPSADLRFLLWKRVDDGAAPTTRLVAGDADPDDPACPSDGTLVAADDPAVGPCDGSFPRPPNDSDLANPRLGGISRDGNTLVIQGFTVRFKRASGDAFRPADDVFLVDMAAGLSRKQALTRLTVGVDGVDGRSGAGVGGVSLSPDGGWIGFTATGWAPNLPRPAVLGVLVPPLTAGRPSAYVIDRKRDLVEQLTTAYDGTGLNDGAEGLDVADDARVVGLQTKATNLFYGDANGVTEDVAVYRRVVGPDATPSEVELPAATPPAPVVDLTPASLRINARPISGGLVRLTVSAPTTGKLQVWATRALMKRSSGKRAKPQPRITKRHSIPVKPGASTVDLALTRTFRPQARLRGGLRANVSVTFTPVGGPAQRLDIATRFIDTSPKQRTEKSSKRPTNPKPSTKAKS